MYTVQNPHISFADEADRISIKDLLNIAYRGEASKKGWTSEAELIAGDTRTDDAMLQKLMKQPGSVFLKYTNDEHEITGCVNLQQHGEKIYLGMFSVSPHMQGAGIGKQILKAAEEYALHKKCTAIYMSVISLRKELIKW
ncbi:MAG: GNAT family N-acetyltransferase, partial [Ginsengibacter sp.]